MAYRYYLFRKNHFLDGRKINVEFSNENELNFAIEKKISTYSLNNEKENTINERERQFMRSIINENFNIKLFCFNCLITLNNHKIL